MERITFMRSRSDERLTELASAGSDAAFEAIVGRYRNSLLRRCSSMLGEADAEEALQEALLRAHLALMRGQHVRSLGPWLHTVASNAALNVLRARSARPEQPLNGCDPVAACSVLGDGVDESAARRQALRDVVERVQALPPRQRDAIVMRELEGLTYDQIAERLDASHGAVRQLLGRARAAIRDRLAAVVPAATIKVCAVVAAPTAVVVGVAATHLDPSPRPAVAKAATHHHWRSVAILAMDAQGGQQATSEARLAGASKRTTVSYRATPARSSGSTASKTRRAAPARTGARHSASTTATATPVSYVSLPASPAPTNVAGVDAPGGGTSPTTPGAGAAPGPGPSAPGAAVGTGSGPASPGEGMNLGRGPGTPGGAPTGGSAPSTAAGPGHVGAAARGFQP